MEKCILDSGQQVVYCRKGGSFLAPKRGGVFSAPKIGGGFLSPKIGGVFPSPKRCETCRAGDRILPDHQTLSGTYTSRGEVAIVGLTWRQDYVPKGFWSSPVAFTCKSYESLETFMILSASRTKSLMSVFSDMAKI